MGHYADENMIPREPERCEFADEGSYAEAMEYFMANCTVSKHIDEVIVDGVYVNKHEFYRSMGLQRE